MVRSGKGLDQMRSQAFAAVEEERFYAAAELFWRYVRQRPDDGAAWYRFGDALRIMGRWEEAEMALKAAAKIRPEKPQPAVRLAMLHEGRGNRAVAETYFSQACQLYGDDVPGWLWTFRGANLAAAGRLEEAERAHRASLGTKDVVTEEAWLNLGYVLRALRRPKEAAEAFEKAREWCPEDKNILEAIRSLEGYEKVERRSRKNKTWQRKNVKRKPKSQPSGG